jgi:glycosyltransferase involved in cell wall biosynthesis
VALIEAAAAGVPAVATRVGGVPFVVEDGRTGILAPAGDEAALSRGVLNLLADPARRRAMGAAARERVRGRFAAERLIADVAALYAACIRERRGA